MKKIFRIKTGYAMAIWILLSVFILFLEFITGPSVNFPVLFVIPIILATWYHGIQVGIALGGIMTAADMALLIAGNAVPFHFEYVFIALVRISILILFAFFIDKIMQQDRKIRHLQSLLPICAACKKIRDKDEQWVDLETYTNSRADINFTHGLCPDCTRAHYHDSGERESG